MGDSLLQHRNNTEIDKELNTFSAMQTELTRIDEALASMEIKHRVVKCFIIDLTTELK
jgi:hypothetical protein